MFDCLESFIDLSAAKRHCDMTGVLPGLGWIMKCGAPPLVNGAVSCPPCCNQTDIFPESVWLTGVIDGKDSKAANCTKIHFKENSTCPVRLHAQLGIVVWYFTDCWIEDLKLELLAYASDYLLRHDFRTQNTPDSVLTANLIRLLRASQ